MEPLIEFWRHWGSSQKADYMTDRDIFDSNEGEARPDKLGTKQGTVRHFDAGTIDDALSLLKKYSGEAKIIAGGVDLVTLMKRKVMLPQVLVNLKTIPGLAYIKEEGGFLKIGALTLLSELAEH